MGTSVGNGYSKPSPGDDGETWADIIEDFIERMAVHKHDGNDSENIAINITKILNNDDSVGVGIPPADMTLGFIESPPFSGNYVSPNIAIPARALDGGVFTGVMRFFITTTPDRYVEFYPTVTYVADTVYSISVNENIPSFKVVYY